MYFLAPACATMKAMGFFYLMRLAIAACLLSIPVFANAEEPLILAEDMAVLAHEGSF